MIISIVGGSGFVGSKLISILENFNVYNLDKHKSVFFNNITTISDIRFKNQIDFKEKTKLVVLLAAEHRDDVSPHSLYYDVNVQGTKNILKKMDENGIKNLIFTSSVAVYGLNKLNPDENHETDPFNHYGKSKLKAEQVIRDWYNNDPTGKSVTIIRPTVIFGERNRGNVYSLLRQISSGRFLMIGNGQNKKSMAYIDNIVAFVKNKIEHIEPGVNIYNYTDNPDISMMKLVSIIKKTTNTSTPTIRIPYFLGILVGYCFDFFSKILGRKFSITSVRVKKFCATTQFNSSKAHKSFKTPFTLTEGLNRTLEHEFVNPKKNDVLFYSE
jgi:GlcNAc-P-P-Und epimerase